jgi:hypothetical protein
VFWLQLPTFDMPLSTIVSIRSKREFWFQSAQRGKVYVEQKSIRDVHKSCLTTGKILTSSFSPAGGSPHVHLAQLAARAAVVVFLFYQVSAIDG